MIKFIKTAHHFDALDETDGMVIEINTDGQTLGEIAEAFNKFLHSCGFDVVDEDFEDE